MLAWLRSLSPDLVGFTCSLWNVGRSMWMAGRAKEQVPGLLAAAGGPEIVGGAAVLADHRLDFPVIGEGEEALCGLVGALAAGRRPGRVPLTGRLLDLARIPDPYLAGTVEREPNDPVYLETVRGCAHSCSYCHYAKAMPGVRRFPRERLGQVLPWARARRVPEIYLMDPSFTSVPGWRTPCAPWPLSRTGGSLSMPRYGSNRSRRHARTSWLQPAFEAWRRGCSPPTLPR